MMGTVKASKATLLAKRFVEDLSINDALQLWLVHPTLQDWLKAKMAEDEYGEWFKKVLLVEDTESDWVFLEVAVPDAIDRATVRLVRLPEGTPLRNDGTLAADVETSGIMIHMQRDITQQDLWRIIGFNDWYPETPTMG